MVNKNFRSNAFNRVQATRRVQWGLKDQVIVRESKWTRIEPDGTAIKIEGKPGLER